jgi:cardiolipin synthase
MRSMSVRTRRVVLAAAVLALATAVALILGFNLMRGEKKVAPEIAHLYSIRDPQFQRTMGVLLGPVILPGNRFEELVNGDAIFPPMLGAIRGAQRTITFETYIYWSGQIGKDFADALAERARAGRQGACAPRLAWQQQDGEGVSRHDERGGGGAAQVSRAALVQHRQDEQPHAPKAPGGRRLDGFHGGVGIAAEWTGNAQDPHHWRDTHFKRKGRSSHRCRPCLPTTG